MNVNSNNIEFGYELISVIPFAYSLHKKGKLDKTISGIGSEPLYYFSKNHEINNEKRSWHNTAKCKFPNIKIHKPFLDFDEFEVPPYKDYYKNDRFVFNKKTLIMCNRYNVEWSFAPINYFSLKTLERLFELLCQKYTVIYINIDGAPELYDNEAPIKLNEWNLLEKYNVINIHDLLKKNKDLTFNELQLMLFANCEHYITMNGGHSILASYFKGTNIVYSRTDKEKKAKETLPNINSFYRWYHFLGEMNNFHVATEKELVESVKLHYLSELPLINILIRTHKRPNYFSDCIKSIENQTYKKVNIVISIDNSIKHQDDYTIPYKVRPVFVTKKQDKKNAPKSNEYGVFFPQNEFFNEMYKHCYSGLVLFVDDDDCFCDCNALQKIADAYMAGNDLIFWRVKSLERTIPSDDNFGKAPVLCDISGIGLAFDSKKIPFASWQPYKRGDYRVAKSLYENTEINKIGYINSVLTKCQNGQHAGVLIDKNKKMENQIKVEIVNAKKGSFHKNGQVKLLSAIVAMQLIKHGVAVFYQEKKEIEKTIVPEKINKVIEVSENSIKKNKRKNK